MGTKLGLAALMTVVTGAAVLWAAAPQAVLQTLKGKVEVKLSGTKVWTPAVEGQTLALSATLSTGFDSSAVVVLGKSSV